MNSLIRTAVLMIEAESNPPDVSIIRIHSPARQLSTGTDTDYATLQWDDDADPSVETGDSPAFNCVSTAFTATTTGTATNAEVAHAFPSLSYTHDTNDVDPSFHMHSRATSDANDTRTWRRRKQQAKRFYQHAKQEFITSVENLHKSNTVNECHGITSITYSLNEAAPKLVSGEGHVNSVLRNRRKRRLNNLKSTSPRWYKQKRYLFPLLCITCLVLSFLIALIILYPSSPSISTSKVSLSQLSWRVDTVESTPEATASNQLVSNGTNTSHSIGGITANLTLSVEISIRNNNRFGAYFSPNSITIAMAHPNTSYFFSLPLNQVTNPPLSSSVVVPIIDPNVLINDQITSMNQQLESVSLEQNNNPNIPIEAVGLMEMPGGYIAARDEISLSLSTSLQNLHLESSLELIQLSNHLKVFATSTTSGKVTFLGISIPYKVSTVCSALCSIDLWSLNVNIQNQQCSSHSST